LEAANIQLQTDIAERKRAEEALRGGEERLRNMFEHHGAIMLLVEPKTGAIVDANAAATRFYGYSREELRTMCIQEINQLPPEEVAAQRQEALELRRNYFLFPHRLADGQIRLVEVYSSPFKAGARSLLFSVIHDVTDRKKAEEALLRSEKLASLGRMAATIAHEINNPLDAVMNLVYLAAGTEDLPESARHLLETADTELKRVAHITRQSLGFYRESNAPTLTSVGAVLDSTIELLKSRIKARHAIIDKQWNGDVQITAAAGELRQVFSNLVSNSLDAIDEQGMIKLRVSVGKHRVRVTIADNGKGIPPSIRQHLFEPYYTTKDRVGTGLGLWISQQIIEKYGGTIRVRSRLDGLRKGTTFSVVLPRGPTAAAQSPSEAA
jgi:PAS domain S-box-containing protein